MNTKSPILSLIALIALSLIIAGIFIFSDVMTNNDQQTNTTAVIETTEDTTNVGADQIESNVISTEP